MTVISSPAPRRPVLLCILDGWGLREDAPDNALTHANLPNWRRMWATYPHAALATSGQAVGLPDGQMGNSEVGHMNIGAGRIAVPELPRIDNAIANGRFAQNPVLQTMIAKIKATGGKLHILGLLSPGGVHSHQDHMIAIAQSAYEAGLECVIHAFTDGRDTPPKSAVEFLTMFERALAPWLARVRIGTLGGRYFGMDRDQRWDRLAQAYAAIADADGLRAVSAAAALAQAYSRGESDEFIAPTVINGYDGMKDGDGLIMANFRADRARQILTALLDDGFADFERPRRIQFAAAAGMASYGPALDRLLLTLFPPVRYLDTLGEWVAKAGLAQLRIAETEKYAHVTFFMNGGEDKIFAGEERILIPSPKVATYDLQPEMSAGEVTDKLTVAIQSGRYGLIVVNYANPDMVGHTGVMAAAVKAAETIDNCLGRLEAAVKATQGWMLVSADHGNLEQMFDTASGQAHTQHTIGPVPVMLVGEGAEAMQIQDGKLADIAPTVLSLMGLEAPTAMTGQSLLVRAAIAQTYA